uniref:Cysteine and histidine-rich domain-containing protein RAR1 n=2 Tax=Oryza TaxID=4527 RepID=RAR1_ORYSJ|nr:cysteine and histidine-rich domain-containing protein RAR1 isoform X2 [Oryza sativa Japonica Group]Q6EPW7.2 RecName: Full=Cysteine and histidine-rich domain-containing protein RAR1; AltName: Full=CHORD domain-containing protein RAR1; AltName: Full=OsRAR1; AltName: Full=Protein REQUIRED FOR MLA12 RESISTANCE 1 [Oryza sativa Japonica Group]
MSTEAETTSAAAPAPAPAPASAPARCQRIGCDATFTDDNNPDGSCQYHPSGPMFHDGMKQWSCCKQKSHDFSLFLAIPGCKTGKHTTEKPITKAVPTKPSKAVPVQTSKQSVGADTCSRCRQGFFCSDHGSQPKAQIPTATSDTNMVPVEKPAVPPPKKKIDLNEPRVCKNKGCGKTYKEKDNHDEACDYHPGPAVFRDRIRGWKCCDIHVKEFDEFMEIPPCTKGWHNADAA